MENHSKLMELNIYNETFFLIFRIRTWKTTFFMSQLSQFTIQIVKLELMFIKGIY